MLFQYALSDTNFTQTHMHTGRWIVRRFWSWYPFHWDKHRWCNRNVSMESIYVQCALPAFRFGTMFCTVHYTSFVNFDLKFQMFSCSFVTYCSFFLLLKIENKCQNVTRVPITNTIKQNLLRCHHSLPKFLFIAFNVNSKQQV